MKRSLLLLIPLLFVLKGCELFDLEMKKVTYLLESNRKYVYESKLGPEGLNNDGRDLGRSDFNIPNTAEIKKFKIKNIWLSVNPVDGNQCTEGHLHYAILVNGDNYTSYENDFHISTEPINEFLINNGFSENLGNLRNRIEQAIINDQKVRLAYVFSCNQLDNSTHVIMIIRFTVDVEYINCEEVFAGSELEDC